MTSYMRLQPTLRDPIIIFSRTCILLLGGKPFVWANWIHIGIEGILKKKKKLNIVYLAFAKTVDFLLLKLCVDRTAVMVGIVELNFELTTWDVEFPTMRCV